MFGYLLRLIAAGIMVAAAWAAAPPASAQPPAASAGLSVDWQDDFLVISGDFPGGEVRIHYLEAYCRPGSTDRDWGETVIPHRAELLSRGEDGRRVKIRDTLADGVVVDHVITAGGDEVDFHLTAHNPTGQASEAHWAQPCMRVDRFTGAGNEDARQRVPAYARQCFLFLDSEPTFLPTEPWADQARYVYGQVYVPEGVNRDDVNPRPLSPLVPSSGLCGCVSADGEKVLAVAWQPYQEIFQGVIACLHSDFRVGGLAPGETKTIRGKIYITENDLEKLAARYREDFANP